jgi:biopolymer transport protein ExbD
MTNHDPNSAQRGPAGIDDVNMTPLIDVSLVLVVILMVAMPMMFQSSIAVRSAAASGREAPIVMQAERVEIAIVSDDSVLVNRVLVGRPHFRTVLAPLLERGTDPIIIVDCADHVSHGTFVGVVDEAKSCGAAQIAVVGR